MLKLRFGQEISDSASAAKGDREAPLPAAGYAIANVEKPPNKAMKVKPSPNKGYRLF
jgi:hypothetical protein